MPKPTLTLSPRAVLAVLTLTLVVAGTVEWNALLAKERRDNSPRVLTLAYCTSCHSDARMLRKMKWKEGSTHFLFKDKANAKPNDCPVTTTTAPRYTPAANWMKQPPPARK